jgi:hypothetical protein
MVLLRDEYNLSGVLSMLMSTGNPSQVFLTAMSCVDQTTSPTNSNASVRFNTNGTITLTGNVSTAGTGWDNGGGVTNYWVRYTNSSGNVPNGSSITAGTWNALSSARTVEQLTNAPGTLTSTGTIDIAADAAGTIIVGTCSLGLGATRI